MRKSSKRNRYMWKCQKCANTSARATSNVPVKCMRCLDKGVQTYEGREWDLLDKEHIHRVYSEAKILLAKRDGIHNMHGCCAALGHHYYAHVHGDYVKNAAKGNSNDDMMQNADYLIRCMRVCDQLGYFPKNGDVAKRNIKRWRDVGG